MLKKILSGVLSVCLCIGILGSSSYAQEDDGLENAYTDSAQKNQEDIDSNENNQIKDAVLTEDEKSPGSPKEEQTDKTDDSNLSAEKKEEAKETVESRQITPYVSENQDESGVSDEWKLTGLEFDKSSPQEVSEIIEMTAKVENENDGILYKYVWMKDNWAEWGVIQDFSDNKTVKWTPGKSGYYSIYVNAKSEGRSTETFVQPYTFIKNQWSYYGIYPEGTNQKLGTSIILSPNIFGNSEGLRYKYVWMKNGWKQWGVLKDFSTDKSIEFTPESIGEYTIYIDIKDQDGDVVTKNKVYNIKTDVWQYEGITTDLPSPQQKYTEPITISASTTGETANLQYKYVWMKEDWKEWGIISDFSSESSTLWYPEDTGDYTLYVDIKDVDGETITKTIPYEIINLQWQFDEIRTNPEEVQRKANNVEIEAVTSGNIEKLKYKFVWMRNDWADWGVIQDFSENSKITWTTPDVAGAYKIYVNVTDRDHHTETLDLNYFVATQIWQPGEININNGVSEQIYTKIPISVSAEGEIQNLQYKFVWKGGPDNGDWGDGWGVIKNFSETNSTNEWYPKEAGIYTIYVDIKDRDGRLKTITKEYQVSEAPWKLDEMKLDGSADRFLGETVTLTADTSGQTEGLQYKFVCRRGDGWSDWEVLQDFSFNDTVTFTLDKDKTYNIYVDIKDQRGVTFDPEIITVRPHNYISATVSSSTISKGKSVTIRPNVTGGTSNLQFKYVWMKDNWKQWGVIKDMSSSASVSWTPKEAGTYYIYIDVKANGVVKTKSVWITVKNVKNGWYYENGYKFYYINDVKQLDLDGILPRQSSYYIKVNRTACTVTVYAKDGNNGYIIPVKRFACSVGLPSTPTPTGTYYTSQKYRWHTLMGPSYGQYCTRIVGGVLFHSVAGRNMTSYNLNARDYNKLGQPASHGCVRLCVRDAKWIYDNCSLRTKVTIYDSSDPGPLGKPATIKIPSYQTWDPTDPNI